MTLKLRHIEFFACGCFMPVGVLYPFSLAREMYVQVFIPVLLPLLMRGFCLEWHSPGNASSALSPPPPPPLMATPSHSAHCPAARLYSFYSFDVGPVHVVGLNPYTATGEASEQHAWLQKVQAEVVSFSKGEPERVRCHLCVFVLCMCLRVCACRTTTMHACLAAGLGALICSIKVKSKKIGACCLPLDLCCLRERWWRKNLQYFDDLM